MEAGAEHVSAMLSVDSRAIEDNLAKRPLSSYCPFRQKHSPVFKLGLLLRYPAIQKSFSAFIMAFTSHILASGLKSTSCSDSEALILTGVASDTGLRQGFGVSAQSFPVLQIGLTMCYVRPGAPRFPQNRDAHAASM